MTKIHETFYRFNLDTFSGFKENLKGELTVVISGNYENFKKYCYRYQKIKYRNKTIF